MASRPKPPIAAWIQRERHRLGLKPAELVSRLGAQGVEVTEQTIRVWESNVDRRPSAYNLEALERVFGSQAPRTEEPVDTASIVAAVDRLTAAVQDHRRAVEDGITALAEVLGTVLGKLADTPSETPSERAGRS